MKRLLTCFFLIVVAGAISGQEQQTSGPPGGSLIIAGGALSDTAVYQRFVELGGGVEARLVYVPTASDDRSLKRTGSFDRLKAGFERYGVKDVTILHTRDRAEANSQEFVDKIDQATAVWFGGGRQWRLADSYLNTATHEALLRLLERGGVIGGSSAGATIQGSYLFRGDTKSNTILCGDHEKGLGFITNIAIDQHLLARNRQFDMFEALDKYPELLGIGLDENTAIEVHQDEFVVIGQSYVAIYDGKFYSADRGGYVEMTRGEYPFYLLKPGQKYDMKERKILKK